MSIIKRKAGSEDIVKSVLEFDAVPTEGSPNLVDSGAVAKFTDAVPEGTTPENPLVNESALAEFELAMLTNIPCAAKTLRFKFSKMDYDPTVSGVGSSGTWKKLNAKFHNVWDWTKSGTTFDNAFDNAFSGSDNLVSVIAVGDTASVTGMSSMFRGCASLTSVPLFNTSSVTGMGSMFRGCASLTSVPLFNTASVTNMSYMFNGCTNVEWGALALYQQASTQTTPPSNHTDTFAYCGKDTATGAAELAQIPVSWGGTMPEP